MRSRDSGKSSQTNLSNLSAKDHNLGIGDGDAVHEAAAHKVVVDEGNLDANLGQAKPGDDVLGPVLHHQRHAVTTSEA